MSQLRVELKEKPAWSALNAPLTLDLQKSLGRIRGTLTLPYPPGTLTIAMIVKNEAKNIREAIESFRPIADEIVVNDTGSTDGTQTILEELGVQWFQGDWRGDFSYARNLAIDQATSSWILWMDADDRIPQDQVELFRKLKTAPLDRAFGFQVINTQGGLPVGGRFMQVRMFPNHPNLRFRYRIHEQVLHAIVGLGF
jgi:glycosyltransferase involved in cell wall biosynthesis